MAYLYILECRDGTYCTGSTKDLEKRFREHQDGQGANYTSTRLPVKLIYSEYHRRVVDAFLCEKQLQKWSHEKKKALIDKDYPKIHELATCRKKKKSKYCVRKG